MKLDRRSILKLLGLGGAAVVVGPALPSTTPAPALPRFDFLYKGLPKPVLGLQEILRQHYPYPADLFQSKPLLDYKKVPR